MAKMGAVANSAMDSVAGFFGVIAEWLDKTNLPQQIAEVDATGLFTNPWFLVPFIALAGYLLWKQAWRDMVIIGLIVGVWYISGTNYMQTLVVGDELQVEKVLPVLFGGAAVLGVIIYLLFGKS
jgi:hypothetical protein